MRIMTLAVLAAIGIANSGIAQDINWRSLREDQHNRVHLSFGYDFGATAEFGYSRFVTVILPVAVGLDCSIPMGGDLLDDFKVRIGGEVEIVEADGFSATLRIASIFRRYQNQLVRIASFGSDFGITAGYFTESWHAAGEFGFDKAIATNLRHSDVMKAAFPAIRDGWYVPTGGHYYFGIQGSKTIGSSLELALRLGKTRVQKSDEEAKLPLYAQLALSMRF